MSEITRSLATVKTITALTPIPGADMIECATINHGWNVVVNKGKHKLQELVLYLELDSWVPMELAPFLVKGKEPREFNGVKGERLRTIRLKGQVSQGLVLPLSSCGFQFDANPQDGMDVTEMLGVQKWERPMNTQLAGQARGNFPSFIRKTDQERVQNLNGKIDWDAEYEITTKLDGSSMTVYFNDNAWGVCSRNLDLKLGQEGNTFVNVAKDIFVNNGFVTEDLEVNITENIAIQGELMGPGIQGNRESLPAPEFFVFDIWDIGAQCYYHPEQRIEFCKSHGLSHVPVVDAKTTLTACGVTSIESALAFAEGPSLVNDIREGVVFKRVDGQFSFKAISNTFLLKEKD
jgi:RNA ligase (TIGR02306 family)